MTEDLNNEVEFEESRERRRLGKLTDDKRKLVKLYAKKHDVDEQMIVDWIEGGMVTMAELSQGILGTLMIGRGRT